MISEFDEAKGSGFLLRGFVWFVSSFLLAACGEPEKEVSSEEELREMEAAAKAFKAEIAEVKKRVEQVLPASAYVDDSLIPEIAELEEPPPFDSVEGIRVGAPWIFNDEVAPWYIAIDLGYFKQAGLEVELVEGGPGRNMLTMLLANQLEIAVAAYPRLVPSVICSPTGGDVVIVNTFLQKSPVGITTLDHTVPKSERSELSFGIGDLRHKVFGVPAGNEKLAEVFLAAGGVPREDVKIVRIASGPELLMAGKIDYMQSWLVNQPRMLEADGYFNWAFLPISEVFYENPADVSVVRLQYLDENRDVIRRYNWALLKAVKFLLDNPERSADLTMPWIEESGLSRAQVLRRFELQRHLVTGEEGQDLLHLNLDDLNEMVAYNVLAGIIELPEETAP